MLGPNPSGRTGGARGDDISERLLAVAVRVIQVAQALPRNAAGRHVADQLLRSGTSAGALYEEARGAESKKDFVHKLGITLKELHETRYWLRLIATSELLPPARLSGLAAETDELCRVIGKSRATVRSKSEVRSTD